MVTQVFALNRGGAQGSSKSMKTLGSGICAGHFDMGLLIGLVLATHNGITNRIIDMMT
jgi:hypothetical protein